ncbi:molecular chaperone DnaJ [soil metagenome]
MATQAKNFYSILGVAENASADEIKKAYRKLAKQNHPDANPNDSAAADRFKSISEAYSVLSDDAKRKQYDQMRKLGAFDGIGGFGGAPRGGRPRPGGPGAPPGGGFDFDTGNLGDVGGLGDLFGSIFDMGRRRGRSQGPERGRSVEYAVDIPFEVAARGGKQAITVPVTENCVTCGGNGARPGTKPVTCPECKGSGTVVFGQGGFAVSRPCPACYGRGTIATDPCATCAGQGQIRRQKQIQVNIPAGVDTGSKLRLAGQGEAGAAGGAPGDIVLTFRVQPHSFFTREGLDVHCTVPVNIAQASLGSRIRVRTLDGRVNLRIPPGTQPGTRFRIKGQGIEKGGQRGDQFVRVDVKVPSNLDPKEETLLREFAEAAELKY